MSVHLDGRLSWFPVWGNYEESCYTHSHCMFFVNIWHSVLSSKYPGVKSVGPAVGVVLADTGAFNECYLFE